METIKSKTEVSQLFHEGKRINTPFLSFIYNNTNNSSGLADSQHGSMGRVAFIAGKKSGNAVKRNFLKRRMRALCKELGGPWKGFDVILLAKEQLLTADFTEVIKVSSRALTRDGSFTRE